MCDKHIPKIKVKESFQLSWFDSDVFKLNKKKEHFRKLFKESKNPQHYKKFSSLRKKLKTLIKAKMRSNFDDDLCPNTITKKCWSSLKSISKSSRIPDRMYLNDCIRSEQEEIANLFNKHFYDQFSDESTYDIGIDFTNDPFSDLKFDEFSILNFLKQINPNESRGISGRDLMILEVSLSKIVRNLYLYHYRYFLILHIELELSPQNGKLQTLFQSTKKGQKLHQ